MIKKFKALVEIQWEYKITVFWLDNKWKYILKVFEWCLKDHGIEKQTSTKYGPQQNKVVERVNYTIVEMVRNMFYAQNFHKSFKRKR